jgi:hypothetical protein
MNVKSQGTWSLLSFAVFLLVSPQSEAMSKKPVEVVKEIVDMSKIKCSFYGRHTSTVGSVDFPADNNTVCDPLTSSNPAPSFENGLLGKLILKTPQMSSSPQSVLEFHTKGQRLEQNLYFADVNVPTQEFTKGFTTRTGEVLVDGTGAKLIENFAIEYTSSLKLAATDSPGHYEIALLADDGARLFVQENNVWNEVINNDGIHQTRMGCPFRTIYLDRNTEIPIKILYYQGPRFYVANVMMWKRHSSAQTWKEPARHSLCGFQGNGLFFSEKNPDRDTLVMKLLKADSWAVVAPANFKMPAASPNPCAEEKLTISEVAPIRNGSMASVTWKTNLPATSQVRITSVTTGEVVMSQLDSNLVNEHSVQIDGLIRGERFLVEVISVDASGAQVVGIPPVEI